MFNQIAHLWLCAITSIEAKHDPSPMGGQAAADLTNHFM